MKDIDNIVRLYEAIDTNKTYYMQTGYYKEIFRGKYIDNSYFSQIVEPKNPGDKIIEKNTTYEIPTVITRCQTNNQLTAWFDIKREENPMILSKNHKYQSKADNLEEINRNHIVEITKEEMDAIKKNNIKTTDELAKYRAHIKNINTIKNPDSTMMDVLCSFGDL